MCTFAVTDLGAVMVAFVIAQLTEETYERERERKSPSSFKTSYFIVKC